VSEKMNIKSVLTPQGFLTVGGVVLVLLGVLGFIGVIGPTPEQVSSDNCGGLIILRISLTLFSALSH